MLLGLRSRLWRRQDVSLTSHLHLVVTLVPTSGACIRLFHLAKHETHQIGFLLFGAAMGAAAVPQSKTAQQKRSTLNAQPRIRNP